MTGVSSREFVGVQELTDFHFGQFDEFRVSHVHLFRKTTIEGNADLAGERMCSRVWGIGPSAAETTRIAPSIWAAPVIMFLM
jgi:hypothetical protein